MQFNESRNTWSFDSMADLSRFVAEKKCIYHPNRSGDWFAYTTGEDALNMCLTGDESRVEEAQSLLSTFDIRIETSGSDMGLGVAGFYPSVPDYLGGSPECMYGMADVQDDSKPLSIIVDVASSCNIDTAALNKRGVTIMAAVMALAATRPITLELVSMGMGNEVKTAKNKSSHVSVARVTLNSSPVDLGTACYALCHPGFHRHILYGVQTLIGFDGQWGYKGKTKMFSDRSTAYIDWALDMLDADPETTLYIPSISSLDETSRNPTEWVESVLAKYSL